MSSKKFTAKWCDSVTTSKKREDFYDYSRLAKGQALVLKVYGTGTKSWWASYYPNGKSQTLLSVGPYASRTGPAGLSLKDADEEAQRKLAMLLDSIDPLQQQRDLKSAPNLAMGAELFLLRHAYTLADSGRKYREIVEREFIPVWRDHKLQELRRRDVVSVLEGIAVRGHRAANLAHAVLRKLFDWCIRRDLLENNPATNIDRPGGVERSRDRVLSHDEICALWAGPGVDRLVIRKILNHTHSGITSVHDRLGYDKEKQQALYKWSRKLQSMTREVRA
jgi:Arm DNA-binding domain